MLENAGKIIKQIENWSDYFIIPDTNSLCQPADMDLQTDKDVYSCEPLADYDDMKKMLQFEMPMGGISIAKTDMNTIPYFDLIGHLLEAGVLMTLSYFVHFDLHLNNILIDKDGIPKIIDYGESFSSRSIDDNIISKRWKVFTPNFSSEAPEITFMTGLRENMNFDKCLHKIAYTKPPLTILEKLIGFSRKEQVERFILFWKTSRSVRDNDILTFWKTYWPMFDSWSMGSDFIEILNTIIRSGGTAVSRIEKDARFPILQKVLKGMLQMNPRDRIDCVEALNMLEPMNPILQKSEAQEWIKKRLKDRNTY